MVVKVVVSTTPHEVVRAMRQIEGIVPFNPTIVIPDLRNKIRPVYLVSAMHQVVRQIKSGGIDDVEIVLACQIEEFALNLYRDALLNAGLHASALVLPAQYPWPLIPFRLLIDAGGHSLVMAASKVLHERVTHDWWPYPEDLELL
ncbi:hypothetical protein KC571_03615 [candidate division WWE3 bacterium]|uniref:Uncharacterized protein n=1 Tax=candidate division WWE3 bacterium TaxID=2053526 RepID=A0A955LH29_UNCKA|nr:hypothetical protein [candidate division WWE3 bacterium]